MSDSRSKPEGRRPVGAPSRSDESAGHEVASQTLDIMTKSLERVELVARLKNALAQASVTPGFANDMWVWSELAGSVQLAIAALESQPTEGPSEREQMLEGALKGLLLQALQSELNSPAHEWGYEAIQKARGALASLDGKVR